LASIDGLHHMQIAPHTQHATGEASGVVMIDMSGLTVEGDCVGADGTFAILSG
jgi:hypothetical protein